LHPKEKSLIVLFFCYQLMKRTMQHQDLNLSQQEAVTHIHGPLLVLAGAGSGKTRVVTNRITHLLEEGIDPQSILAITFTNKAADEMRNRVQEMTNSHVWISTFHSLGAKMLREMKGAHLLEADFTIYDDDDREKALKRVLDELGIKDKDLTPKSFKTLIGDAKNKLLSPDDWVVPAGASKREEVFPKVYRMYQRILKTSNAADFDDLLYLPARILKENVQALEFYQKRWEFVLIDEYQDTNEAQYQLIKMLVNKSKNLFVVGDPDQSIYSWRGADISNILDFERDYQDAKTIRLEQNYRSSMLILEAANALIEHNEQRLSKALWSEKKHSEKVTVFRGDNEWDEARFVIGQVEDLHYSEDVPFEDMAIFYRTNFQSRVFEDVLLQKQIPYVVVGGVSFYQRKEIKDVLAFLRMVHSGKDFLSFARSINLPKRGVGPATLEKIGNFAEGQDLIPWLQNLLEDPDPVVKLNQKQRIGIDQYIELILSLREMQADQPLSYLVSQAIEKSGYLFILESELETKDDRKGNLDELVLKALEWQQKEENLEEGLGKFLEELSLMTQVDSKLDRHHAVNLMTFHHGKGLEFSGVFLVGMEESLFPHFRSQKDKDALEEERRLCYVGMTRAKRYLHLSSSRTRFLWGQEQVMSPSRFLKEIPSELVVKKGSYRAESKRPSFHFKRKEEEKPVNNGKFQIGDEVEHKQFGKGVIQEVKSGSLGIMYVISFEGDSEKKTLLEKYAKLQALV
jgi:DNA helicase II / ATP-dependent DNA helicase PcrA